MLADFNLAVVKIDHQAAKFSIYMVVHVIPQVTFLVVIYMYVRLYMDLT